jgi:hypothetical protein
VPVRHREPSSVSRCVKAHHVKARQMVAVVQSASKSLRLSSETSRNRRPHHPASGTKGLNRAVIGPQLVGDGVRLDPGRNLGPYSLLSGFIEPVVGCRSAQHRSSARSMLEPDCFTPDFCGGRPMQTVTEPAPPLPFPAGGFGQPRSQAPYLVVRTKS